jgi:ACS family tartrate transporter-like MFS transporter
MHCAADGERTALRQAAANRFKNRIAPYLACLFLLLFLDRQNISFAGLQMARELQLSASAFGLAFGIFSVGYCLCEVPSMMLLRRFGVRVWLTRIMVTWGLLSAATAFVTDTTGLFVLRFLLGAAEAGFVPGVLYYLALWLPAEERGRVIGIFMLGVPLASIIGAPVSGLLLSFDALGLHGWQWLFLLEGLPSVLFGLSILYVLPDGPDAVGWLTPAQKTALHDELAAERARVAAVGRSTAAAALFSPVVLVLGLIYLANGVGLFGMGAWLPTCLHGLGLSYLQVGLAVAFVHLTSAIVQVLWTRHSDQTAERIWHVALPSLLGTTCLAVGALSGANVLTTLALGLGLILLNPATPSLWNLPAKYLSGAGAALGLALISSLGSLGAFIGPAVVGIAKDRSGGLASGMLLIALGPLLAGVATLALRWHRAFGSTGRASSRLQALAAGTRAPPSR